MICRDETSDGEDLRNSTEILSQSLHFIVSQRMARSRYLGEFLILLLLREVNGVERILL